MIVAEHLKTSRGAGAVFRYSKHQLILPLLAHKYVQTISTSAYIAHRMVLASLSNDALLAFLTIDDWSGHPARSGASTFTCGDTWALNFSEGVVICPLRTSVFFVSSDIQGAFFPNKISGVGTIFGLLVHVLPGANKQRA